MKIEFNGKQYEVCQEDLDELVFECKSDEAGVINNSGSRRQLQYLKASLGEVELTKELEASEARHASEEGEGDADP